MANKINWEQTAIASNDAEELAKNLEETDQVETPPQRIN